MKEQLASLFEYAGWVTHRLLTVASGLTEEQFDQKVLPGIDSLHQTLVHILGAEMIWLARLQGQSPKTMLAPSELPTLQALHERWAELEAQQRAYVAGLAETDMGLTVSWTNMRGQSYALPRWQVMLHSVNHSTHHRSEVAALLTALGHPPASTDLLEFYLARAGQPWKPTGQT